MVEQTIGEEAKKLDNESIFERMKIEKQAIGKIALALVFYGIMMFLMEFFL